jgi:putative MATE family efflux protein
MRQEKLPEGRRDLTQGPLFWTMFRLAAPLAAGMFFRTLYNLVDTFWLGRVSKEALAAPGVSMPLIFTLLAFGIGFGSAATALVAQHTGAKQHREADHTAAQSLMVLTVISILLSFPMIFFAEHVLRFVRVPADVIPRAGPYLSIFMMAMPLMGFGIGYDSVLRALGDTRTMVVVNMAGNVINAALDPVLIFGWGPFPAMGARGAAAASAVSICLAFIACVILLLRGRAGLRPRLRDFLPDKPVLRRLFSVGVPAGLSTALEGIGFTVFQVMVNKLGAVVIGAFMIGARITNFLDIPAQCTSMAAAPVVGQALGAGKVPLARRAIYKSVLLVAVVMFIPYGLIMWKGGLVARAFVTDPAVIAETRRFFYILPISHYSFGVLNVFLASYRGAGRTRPLLMVTILRQWLLRLPLCLILGFAFGLGSIGIYIGMALANLLCAGLSWWLFRSGGWEQAVIPVSGADTD